MIAIIGAGMTGLALGLELAAADADFVIIEATDRVGGVIRSGRVEGHLLDWGPQRTRRVPSIARLVDDLQLDDQVITSPPGLGLFVYRRGRLRTVPFTPAGFFRTDILSPAQKVRLLLEPLTRAPRAEERVGRMLRRKLGRGAYENIVAPLYGGLYGSDPDEMIVGSSIAHVLREFGVQRSLLLPLLRRGGRVDPPPTLSFRDGMQTLPAAMAARLGDRVRLSTPVRGIEAAPHGGWRLRLDGETIAAETVVLTTPAPAAARLLAGPAPTVAARLGTLRYNPLAVVHLHAETGLRGLGFQVALVERLALRGVTFNDSLFGRRNVYTAYLGGASHPEVVSGDDHALAALAVAEFHICTGHAARPLAVAREAMPAWDVTWSALAGMQLPDGIIAAANWESRPGLPGRLSRAAAVARDLLPSRGSPAQSTGSAVPRDRARRAK
jgi:protoporphyrinogen/coproporphyrinogen III oxidase